MDAPLVSVIVPMRNERAHIASCLASVLAGTHPHDRLEILVVDGCSEDGSRDAVTALTREHPAIRLLDNTKRTTPAALNVGLAEAGGEFVIRMDAHATYPPTYIETCVRLLRTTGAANVGGVRRAVGDSYAGRCIAVASSHPFGVGHTQLRATDRERWVDTVYLGAWRTETLRELDGFAEDFDVNQDFELNHRLRASGGRILLSPELSFTYRVRPSWRALARQFFRYGRGRVRTGVVHPGSLRYRHLVPPLGTLTALVSAAAVPAWTPAAAGPLAYAAACLGAAVHACRRRPGLIPGVAVSFAVMHAAWGAGFWTGVARFGMPWPRAVSGPGTSGRA